MMQYYILDKKNWTPLHYTKINQWRLNQIQKQNLHISGNIYYLLPDNS